MARASRVSSPDYRLVLPALLLLAASCSGPRRPNVILVVLDTVRRDHLGCYGHDRPTSPNLDRFASGATLYERAVSAAPWTLPSHASMFTGLLPSRHRAHHEHLRLDDERTTLAEYLRDAGYETAGFCNNPWITERLGLTQGFESYTEIWRERVAGDGFGINVFVDPQRHGLQDAGAGRLVEAVRGWLDARDRARPFFLFVNVIEAHAFYDPPGDFRGRFAVEQPSRDEVKRANFEFFDGAYKNRLTPQAVERAVALYDAEIAYVDTRFGDLVDLLAGRGLLDESLVFVTSDHGEGFGEHELFGFPLVDHQLNLHSEVVDVPLVVRYPKGLGESLRGKRVPRLVSTLDLLPTALEAAGLAPADALDGTSLLDESAPLRRTVVSEYFRPLTHAARLARAMDNPEISRRMVDRRLASARRGDVRVVVSSTDATPAVQTVSAASRDEIDALAAIARQRLAEMEAATAGAAPRLEQAQREALEALGYLD